MSGRPGRAGRRRARRRPPPLPQLDGLDAVRWRIPRDAAAARPALEALRERFPALAEAGATPLDLRFARGDIVDAEARPWTAGSLVGPDDELWFHRELREERVDAAELPIIHRDEHLLVLDKPHDMATMPRGAHVLSSALVRLRRATGITTLVPLHRLDRRTAGVLAFGIVPEERAAYQQLFARGEVTKVYEARVRAQARADADAVASPEDPVDRGIPTPSESPAVPGIPTAPGESALLLDHLVKQHGELTARVLPGEPNARTRLEVLAAEPDGTLLLRLHPWTGRTHQLRVQLSARGAPIVGEDLYPEPRTILEDDARPGAPLQLLARSLAFTDPITGRPRHLVSGRQLAGPLAHGPRTLSL